MEIEIGFYLIIASGIFFIVLLIAIYFNYKKEIKSNNNRYQEEANKRLFESIERESKYHKL